VRNKNPGFSKKPGFWDF